MGIDAGLREKLVCPKCKGPLTDAQDGRALDCQSCKLRYKVEKYGETWVPDMIIEHAQELRGEDDKP